MTNKLENTPDQGLWRSMKSAALIIGVALGGVLTTTPAEANDGFEEAHSLRSLDIMLMVTALRCRSGPHDFQNDYHRFSANHLPQLNAAGRTLRRSFAASYGESNPARALDRMGVKIANAYGGGHPWMSCAELKEVTQDLSQMSDPKSLARQASYLLSASRPQPEPDTQLARNQSQDQSVQITYNMTADWEKRP